MPDFLLTVLLFLCGSWASTSYLGFFSIGLLRLSVDRLPYARFLHYSTTKNMRHTLVTQLGKRPTLSSRSHLPSRIRPQGNRSTSSAPKGPEKNVSSQNAQSNAAPPSSTQSSCSSATPRTVPVGARSRSLRDVIVEGPLGKLGRSYSRIQERRPYATQFWSSIVVYLCGDLSAQVLFPSDNKSAKDVARGNSESSSKTESEDNDSATSGGGYDPWRTLRHLTVGAGSSIPSYNWSAIPGL